MTWFQSPLVWSRKVGTVSCPSSHPASPEPRLCLLFPQETYHTSWKLQMPVGVPVAAGVLAFLAFLALAYHCLKEVPSFS